MFLTVRHNRTSLDAGSSQAPEESGLTSLALIPCFSYSTRNHIYLPKASQPSSLSPEVLLSLLKFRRVCWSAFLAGNKKRSWADQVGVGDQHPGPFSPPLFCSSASPCWLTPSMDLNGSEVSSICRGYLLALEEFLKCLVSVKFFFFFFEMH